MTPRQKATPIIEYLMHEQGFEFAAEEGETVFLCKDGITIAVSCNPKSAERAAKILEEAETKEMDRRAEEDFEFRAWEKGNPLY